MSPARLDQFFDTTLSRLIDRTQDVSLEATSTLLEAFLGEMERVVSSKRLSGPQAARVFAMLLSILVEAGQYRHESCPDEYETHLERMKNMRYKAANLLIRFLSRPEFNELKVDFTHEVVPIVSATPNRFYSYRVNQAGSIFDIAYDMRDRTNNRPLRRMLERIYRLKYARFGTSGVRGLWMRDITKHRVQTIVQAVCDHLKRDVAGADTIVIGYDSRLHANEIAQWAASVCLANGLKVALASRDTPTPVLNFWTIHRAGKKIAGLINCTASHNPPEWQGVKYILKDGRPAPTSVTDWIESRANQLMISGKRPRTFDDLKRAKARGRLTTFDAIDEYCEWLTSKTKHPPLRTEIVRDWFHDKLVVVDEMHGAGREYLRRILDTIGVPYSVIHGYPHPTFGNLGYASPEEPFINVPDGLKDSVLNLGATIGVAMDTDADRFGVVDGDGTFYNPNQMILMLVDYLLNVRHLRGKVIRTITTFPMLDSAVAEHANDGTITSPDKNVLPPYLAPPFYQVRLGDKRQLAGTPTFVVMVGIKYQAEAMRMNCEYALQDDPNFLESFVLAGEESGGITTQAHIADKDGLWTDMLILEMVAYHRKSLRDIWKSTVQKFGPEQFSGRIDLDGIGEVKDGLVNYYLNVFPNTGQEKKIAGLPCTYIGGIENDFVEINLGQPDTEKGRLIIRGSGTEPICRVYTECTSNALRRRIEEEVVGKMDALASQAISNAHSSWHLLRLMTVTPPLPKVKAAVQAKMLVLSHRDENEKDKIWAMLAEKAKRLDTRRRQLAERWLSNR